MTRLYHSNDKPGHTTSDRERSSTGNIKRMRSQHGWAERYLSAQEEARVDEGEDLGREVLAGREKAQ